MIVDDPRRTSSVAPMKFVFSLFASMWLISAHAEVIIYKHNLNVKHRTDGWSFKTNYTGWTVIDIQTGQLGIVKVFGTWFDIEQPDSDNSSLQGAPDRLKPLGVIAIKDGEFAGLTARGINKSVAVGLSENWAIPRTLTVNGSRLVYTNNSFPVLPEVYDRTDLPPVPTATRIRIQQEVFNGTGLPPLPPPPLSAASSEPQYVQNPPEFFPGSQIRTNNFSLNRVFEQRFFREFKGAMIYDRLNTLEAIVRIWISLRRCFSLKRFFWKKVITIGKRG